MTNIAYLKDRLTPRLQGAKPDLSGTGGGNGVEPPSEEEDTGPMKERLAKLEGTFDWFKWTIPLLVAVMLGGFSLLSTQINRIDGRIDRIENTLGAKIDGIQQRLTEEFRAMRADTAAQTSAIANSITAARQVQPQVIVIPEPRLQPAPQQTPPP